MYVSTEGRLKSHFTDGATWVTHSLNDPARVQRSKAVWHFRWSYSPMLGEQVVQLTWQKNAR